MVHGVRGTLRSPDKNDISLFSGFPEESASRIIELLPYLLPTYCSIKMPRPVTRAGCCPCTVPVARLPQSTSGTRNTRYM